MRAVGEGGGVSTFLTNWQRIQIKFFGGKGERTRGREWGVNFLNKDFTTVKNGRGGSG